MKRITAILILTFICHFNPLYSQTKTPYEKKKEEIAIKYLKKMGVSISEINRVKEADKSGLLLLLLIGEKFEAYQYSHGMESLVLMSEWEKEYKAAESLKNEEDFRRELEIAEKAEREKEAKRQKYQEERRLEEQKREEQRIAEEKRREEEYQKALIQYSDLQGIKNNIASQFSDWAKKSEFETEGDYLLRMKNKWNFIDSLTFKYASGKVATLFGQYSNYNGQYSIELKSYNADKNLYPIVLIGEFDKSRLGNVKLTLNDTLNVDVELAKRIRNIAYRDDYSESYIIQTFQNDKVKFSKNINEWMITSKGYFFPKSYTFFDEYTHANKHVQTQVNKLVLKTDELGLQRYFPTDYSINIEKIWVKELEKERNKVINQAAKYFAENKFEQAKKLYVEANSMKYTEDVKTKIAEIENRIIEIKQNELIKSADQFEKSGKISNSIEKLEEANKLKFRNDLVGRIDGLKKNRELAFTNHKILDSLYSIAQSENIKLFNGVVNPSSLDLVKSGYGQKYLDCKSKITDKVNSSWSSISKSNAELSKNRNREVWNDKSQELMQQVNDFRIELSENRNFESNIYRALMGNDKKYLKIFKENNLDDIIDFINSNSN